MKRALPRRIKPCAIWSDDCQGKKDYDGRLISISTRYWPPAGQGGSMMVSNQGGEMKISEVPYRCDGRASAHAAIVLNFDAPDEPGGFGESADLVEADFVGDTEDDVKRQVEAWVVEQANRILMLLRNSLPGLGSIGT